MQVRENQLKQVIGISGLDLASETIFRVSNNIINYLFLSLSLLFSSVSLHLVTTFLCWLHFLVPYGSFLYMDGDVPRGNFNFISYHIVSAYGLEKKGTLSYRKRNYPKIGLYLTQLQWLVQLIDSCSHGGKYYVCWSVAEQLIKRNMMSDTISGN